jgi:hypothetical protein
LHAEVSSSAVQVSIRLTDEPPMVFHDESNRGRIVNVGTPSIDACGTIEWRLRSEPLVLADDGIDQIEQRVKIIGGRESNGPSLSLSHERMMVDSESATQRFARFAEAERSSGAMLRGIELAR